MFFIIYVAFLGLEEFFVQQSNSYDYDSEVQKAQDIGKSAAEIEKIPRTRSAHEFEIDWIDEHICASFPSEADTSSYAKKVC